MVRYGLALLEAGLLSRLILKLFAARPDNPSIAAIFAVTGPLVAPLRGLDAGQPRYGAVLEFSTLLICLIVPVVWYAVARAARRPVE